MRKITILEITGTDPLNVQCVFWFEIATKAGQVPAPSFKSRVPLLLEEELMALETGVLREEHVSVEAAASASEEEIKAAALLRYEERASQIMSEKPIRFLYGATYDGEDWH